MTNLSFRGPHRPRVRSLLRPIAAAAAERITQNQVIGAAAEQLRGAATRSY